MPKVARSVAPSAFLFDGRPTPRRKSDFEKFGSEKFGLPLQKVSSPLAVKLVDLFNGSIIAC